MKKTICVLLAVVMAFSIASCGTGNVSQTEDGRQTASAYLDQSGDAVVEVTVDLSGGWSVEFARGAVYLYDGEITAGKECAAMLVTLDRDVYEDDLATAMADEKHKESASGVYYTMYEDDDAYLTSLNDSAYVLITAGNQADIEAVVSRFMLSLTD